MYRPVELFFAPFLAVCVAAQGTPEPAAGSASPAAPVTDGKWSEGLGRAATYRAALAEALEDAVAKAKGVWLSTEPSLQSRLAVVAGREVDDGKEAFSGSADREHDWVKRQVSGFIRTYEVQKMGKPDDAKWEVRVRALVAGVDAMRTELVVELQDNGLGDWQLERFEEGGPGRAFDRRSGRYQGPKISEYLRRSGAVKIAAPRGKGQVAARIGAMEPSHRVRLEWQPVQVRSLVEKPNKARPTKGPRPEYMSAGAVTVSVRVDDLLRGVTVLDEALTVPAAQPQKWSAERLDGFVTELVDRAKAQVAQKIFFTLRPPVVLRKWAGDGGEWFAEVRVAKRIAAGFSEFALGVEGSLASPDWQPLATAELVGGSAASCTFRLKNLADPSRVEVGVSQVRPVR